MSAELKTGAARGIGAIRRGGADSPTALGKGANEDKVNWPLFLMVTRPNDDFNA